MREVERRGVKGGDGEGSKREEVEGEMKERGGRRRGIEEGKRRGGRVGAE